MAFTSANGRTQTSLSEINITPLVDVVLVLFVSGTRLDIGRRNVTFIRSI